MQTGNLLQLLDHWKSITSNSFVFNMVQSHHIHLRYHLLLFCNCIWFNIKAALAHHSITQKEVDELLGKDGIEPSTGSTVFTQCVCGT